MGHVTVKLRKMFSINKASYHFRELLVCINFLNEIIFMNYSNILEILAPKKCFKT